MSAFLRVADAKEETEPKLKVWVKQVHDAAHDTEDVLDKFRLHLADQHGDGFHGFVCKIWSSIKTLKARHQIASEVHRIKSRVISISLGHQRYHDIYGTLQQGSRSTAVNNAWNVNTWEAIKYVLPDNNSGSRVILTTRFAHIASTCCEETEGNVYNLMPLSPKESWTLFCNKTFQGNLCPPHLKEISLRILKRCEGLPLAIVAISGVLTTKDWSRIDEWEMLYRSFGAEFEGNDKLENMKKALSLSYNDLPYYLKICLLYLSIP
ncbi:hypothetical protein ACSBR1_038008 [Camellia fascicularis]